MKTEYVTTELDVLWRRLGEIYVVAPSATTLHYDVSQLKAQKEAIDRMTATYEEILTLAQSVKEDSSVLSRLKSLAARLRVIVADAETNFKTYAGYTDVLKFRKHWLDLAVRLKYHKTADTTMYEKLMTELEELTKKTLLPDVTYVEAHYKTFLHIRYQMETGVLLFKHYLNDLDQVIHDIETTFTRLSASSAEAFQRMFIGSYIKHGNHIELNRELDREATTATLPDYLGELHKLKYDNPDFLYEGTGRIVISARRPPQRKCKTVQLDKPPVRMTVVTDKPANCVFLSTPCPTTTTTTTGKPRICKLILTDGNANLIIDDDFEIFINGISYGMMPGSINPSSTYNVGVPCGASSLDIKLVCKKLNGSQTGKELSVTNAETGATIVDKYFVGFAGAVGESWQHSFPYTCPC